MPSKAPAKPLATKQPGTSTTRSKDKTRRKPKQPLPAPERLCRLFTSLCAQIDGGHFANAIKTCDKILRLEPNDPDAMQTKLFLLLQTEQYTPAMALIDTLDASSAFKFDFGKAYSLYRLHRETEATAALDTIKLRGQQNGDEEDRGVIHLEAQLAYREGAYQTAFDLYTQLLDTAEPHSEEHSDLLINLAAAQAHIDFLDSGYRNALGTLSASAASAVESAPPPLLPMHSVFTSAFAQDTRKQEGGDDQEKGKKIRMKRLPKSVVLGVTPPPDPERWLKKSERSSFAMQSKRRKGGGGATQGIVEKENTGAGVSGGKGRRKK